MAGGLTQEQINALMATTRTKGQYIQLITEFLDSDENGVDVKVQWPELSERKSASVKQGFENAKNSKNARADFKNVQVLKNEENVYLIKRTAPAEAAAEAA